MSEENYRCDFATSFGCPCEDYEVCEIYIHNINKRFLELEDRVKALESWKRDFLASGGSVI